MSLQSCECEHVDHFNVDGPAHTYGQAKAVTTIKTPYGTFAQCSDCRKSGHMA